MSNCNYINIRLLKVQKKITKSTELGRKNKRYEEIFKKRWNKLKS